MSARYRCPECQVLLTLMTPPEPRFECPNCERLVTLAPLDAPPGPPRGRAKPAPAPPPIPEEDDGFDPPHLPATAARCATPAGPAESRGLWRDRRVRIGAAGAAVALLALVLALALRSPGHPAGQAKTDPPAVSPPTAPPGGVPPAAPPKAPAPPLDTPPAPNLVPQTPLSVPVAPAPRLVVAPAVPRRVSRFVIGKDAVAPGFAGPYVSGVAFSADRRRLAVAHSSGAKYMGNIPPKHTWEEDLFRSRIVLWNLEEETEVRDLKPATKMDWPHRPAFSADGLRVLALSGRETGPALATNSEASVRVWDTATGKELAARSLHSPRRPGVKDNRDTGCVHHLGCAVFTPDERVVTGSGDGEWIHGPAWNPPPKGDKRPVNDDPAPTHRSLGVLDEKLAPEERRFAEGLGPVGAVVVSPDGKHVFAASAPPPPLPAWELYTHPVPYRAWRKVEATAAGSVRQWELATGREVRAFPGQETYATCLAVSADGRRLLAGDATGAVRSWDVETGKLLREFDRLNSLPSSLALSPDGRWALVGTRPPGDGAGVYLYDARSGKNLLRVREVRSYLASDEVPTVAFSRDGRRVYVVVPGDSKEVVVECWELPQLAPEPDQQRPAGTNQ